MRLKRSLGALPVIEAFLYKGRSLVIGGWKQIHFISLYAFFAQKFLARGVKFCPRKLLQPVFVEWILAFVCDLAFR